MASIIVAWTRGEFEDGRPKERELIALVDLSNQSKTQISLDYARHLGDRQSHRTLLTPTLYEGGKISYLSWTLIEYLDYLELVD